VARITDPKGEWAEAIGRAFVAFGAIEYITVICLREIPKDKIQRSTGAFKLNQRIELICELLEAHLGAEFERMSQDLMKAKELSHKRNLISHNPLMLSLYENLDGSISHKEAIVSLRKENHQITLQELQSFASDCDTLVSSLYGSTHAVFDSLRGGASA
jgi:hypothetical protein